MPAPAASIASTDSFRILWHPDERLLEFIWVGFMSGPELREAFDSLLNHSVTLGAQRWLTNLAALTAMRLADQDWLVLDFSPRVAATISLRRSAMVRPNHPLGAYFLDSMIARLIPVRPWPLRGFTTREAAYAWLTAPEEPASGDPPPRVNPQL